MTNLMHADALESAIQLAVRAHSGQRDKAGEPYILHLLRVMNSVHGSIAQQAAVLHDIVEDTETKFDDLVACGVSSEAIDAVRLLTHDLKTTYCEYVIALSTNETARAVKIADLEDNYRIQRAAYREEHREEDARRLQRYVLTHQYLRQSISVIEYSRRMAFVEA